MNDKFKKILITLSTLALVACNGGGGGSSSGGDTPSPTPSPSPTPVVVQPLTITQNIIPNLNKIGGHQMWYMIVNNPNSFDVNVLSSTDSGYKTTTNFRYDNANAVLPVNPTQYAMKYNNEVGNYSDCLTLFSQGTSNSLASGQSCAFKLDAQWNINTTVKTNFNFKMAYQFEYAGTTYIESIGCVAKPSWDIACLNDNQNLSFNLINESHLANDLVGVHIGNGTNFGGNIISMDGSTFWDTTTTNNVAYQYAINYNSVNNTYTKTLSNTYNGTQFSGNSAISTNGANYYSGNYNQYGIMPLVPGDLYAWIYGMDGNIYGSSFAYGNDQIFYELNQTNNSLIQIIPVSNQFSKGVALNGNLWTQNKTTGEQYCYNKQGGYSKTTLDFKGLSLYDVQVPTVNANGYYQLFINTTDYYNLYNNSQNVTLNYLVDVQNCNINKINYLAGSQGDFNNQYGLIVSADNGNSYIESFNQFSNGLNGN